MISQRYDTIVVGAGIAGLLTALRLLQHGQRVLIIEKDKIGSGITLANHGMIHSGALYVSRHGHIVRQCKEAQEAFSTLVPKAELPTEDAVYLTAKAKRDGFIDHLRKYDIPFRLASLKAIPEIKSKNLQDFRAILVQERVFSSKKILEEIASCCMARDAHFLTGTNVSRIVHEGGKIMGLTVGLNEVIACDNVVIANGLGVKQLLQGFNSHYCKYLKSRLDMMVHLPNSSLKRGLIFGDLDKPILMPAKQDTALGAFFGDSQPLINGERRFPVDFNKAKLLIDIIDAYFDHQIVNTRDALFYTCGKIDYIGNKTAEKGYIDPGFHVINHKEHDNIAGLYSIVTGKMTLGFHASKSVADSLLRLQTKLVIKQTKRVKIPQDILAVEPWALPSEI